MHSPVCTGVEMCIRCDLLALIKGGLRSLDARVWDSGLAWTVRSADRIPCWAVGNFSFLVGIGKIYMEAVKYEVKVDCA